MIKEQIRKQNCDHFTFELIPDISKLLIIFSGKGLLVISRLGSNLVMNSAFKQSEKKYNLRIKKSV